MDKLILACYFLDEKLMKELSFDEKCKHPSCKKNANFGSIRQKKYCKNHRTKECKKIRHFCKFPLCKKYPSFGKEGKKIYCFSHKTKECERDIYRTCIISSCKRSRAPARISKKYCSYHKDEGI